VFGVNPSEFIVLLVVAAVVLGPERLPEYAQSLARMVRELRRMAQGASAQVRNELGPEFDDIDWAKLDPRQYDPRRIVREALSDVWDPDDPLGLKEGNRPRQPGDDEVDGPGPGGAYDGEKPQSAGGPASATPTANPNGYPAPRPDSTNNGTSTALDGDNSSNGTNGETSSHGTNSETSSNGTNDNGTNDGRTEAVPPPKPPPAFDPDAT
jgi:sec-independent protein translocase protein TatB